MVVDVEATVKGEETVDGGKSLVMDGTFMFDTVKSESGLAENDEGSRGIGDVILF